MRVLLATVFILSSFILEGQSFLSSFQDQNRSFIDLPYVCGWQAYRFNVDGYNSIQFDVRGTAEELSQINLIDVRKDFRDIYEQGYRTHGASRLVAQGWEVDFHTSIVFWPLNRKWLWVSDYTDAFIPQEFHQDDFFEHLELPAVNMVIAWKDLGGGQYHVSFVQFLKYCYGDCTGPAETNCSCLNNVNASYFIDQLPDTIRILKQP